MPVVEEIATTRPERCWRITGSTARVTFSGPNRVVSTCVRKSSGLITSKNPASKLPALLTRTSIRPNRSTAARAASWASSELVTSSFTARRLSCAPGCVRWRRRRCRRLGPTSRCPCPCHGRRRSISRAERWLWDPRRTRSAVRSPNRGVRPRRPTATPQRSRPSACRELRPVVRRPVASRHRGQDNDRGGSPHPARVEHGTHSRPLMATGRKMRNRGADISVNALPSFDHVNSWFGRSPRAATYFRTRLIRRVPGRSAVVPAALWDR